ncbi:unnamed protein product [Rhodiola kirilowii]
MGEQGGRRVWASGGDKCRVESVDAKSISSGQEVQGPSESTHCVTKTPLGKEVSSELSLSRFRGKVKESGKLISFREVSDCSWDATLKSFLQQKGKWSAGLGTNDQTGEGLSLSLPGKEGQGKEYAQVVNDEQILVSQIVVAADVGFIPDAQFSEERSDDICSQNEVFSSSLGCSEGASARMVKKKPSLDRVLAAKPHDSFKVAKRKESKVKVVSKIHRRKKRALLDRLKNSYIEESPFDSVREGLDEAERKSIQRKEVEETVKFAKALGIKASLPDEEVVQIFIKRDEERRREREEEERRNREVL